MKLSNNVKREIIFQKLETQKGLKHKQVKKMKNPPTKWSLERKI
jgi:hypothetical protein